MLMIWKCKQWQHNRVEPVSNVNKVSKLWHHRTVNHPCIKTMSTIGMIVNHCQQSMGIILTMVLGQPLPIMSAIVKYWQQLSTIVKYWQQLISTIVNHGHRCQQLSTMLSTNSTKCITDCKTKACHGDNQLVRFGGKRNLRGMTNIITGKLKLKIKN